MVNRSKRFNLGAAQSGFWPRFAVRSPSRPASIFFAVFEIYAVNISLRIPSILPIHVKHPSLPVPRWIIFAPIPAYSRF